MGYRAVREYAGCRVFQVSPAAALVAAIEEDWEPPEACRKARQKNKAKSKRAARIEAKAAGVVERQAAQDDLRAALPPGEQAAILAAARAMLWAENAFLTLRMDAGKDSRAMALERLRRGLLAERVGE